MEFNPLNLPLSHSVSLQCCSVILLENTTPKLTDLLRSLDKLFPTYLLLSSTFRKQLPSCIMSLWQYVSYWWNLNHWDTSFWQNAGKSKKLTGRKKPIDDQIGVWNRLQYVTLGMSSNNFPFLSLFWFLLLRLKHGNLICLHVVVIILWYWFVKCPSCVSIVLILSVHFSFLIGAL